MNAQPEKVGLKQARDPVPCFRDNYDHLAAELAWLDLLIQRRIVALRLENQVWPGLAADPHIYISHAAADRLLSQNGHAGAEPPELSELDQQLDERRAEIDVRVRASLEQRIFLALPALARLFGLSTFERQTVLICLAPELRRKYDRLYAYLQDDITRKRPSVDLVLDLLCRSEDGRWTTRSLLSGQSRLLRASLVQMVPDPASPSGSSGLARFLALEPRILCYILGYHTLDARLADATILLLPAALDDVFVDASIKRELQGVANYVAGAEASLSQKLILHLSGPRRVGKQALAQGMCERLDCALLRMNVAVLFGQPHDAITLLRLVFREGLLQQAAVYLDNLDALLADEQQAHLFMEQLSAVVVEYGWVAIVATETARPLPDVATGIRIHDLAVPLPDVPLRQAVWETALVESVPGVQREWAQLLAQRFQLTPEQIHSAAAEVAYRLALADGDVAIQLGDLYAACRRQSQHKLFELALNIQPQREWEDLVLPEDKKAQLREICSQVQHHYRVWEEWGFGRKMAYGKGLSVLFSGPPGTGKTLAAEVMAGALGLDLYKIDLSGVVSKYIGETEKNLERVFSEAERSNAILFFDEADALFGKRTQVNDAHDRYANIETSYLLQRMELYQGMVILASNLRENMDEAFTRRLRFIVEFPFPDADGRLAIWRVHLPAQVPLSEDIDCDALAQRYLLAGGGIRNIVLNAAFLAAEEGQSLGQDHIHLAARREYEKMGKLWRGDDTGRS